MALSFHLRFECLRLSAHKTDNHRCCTDCPAQFPLAMRGMGKGHKKVPQHDQDNGHDAHAGIMALPLSACLAS